MPTSPRNGTSKLLKLPSQLTGGPYPGLPPLGPYGLSKSYHWKGSPPAFPPPPMLPPPTKLMMPSSIIFFLHSLPGPFPPSATPLPTTLGSPRMKSPQPCHSVSPPRPRVPTPFPTLFGNPFTALLQISWPPFLVLTSLWPRSLLNENGKQSRPRRARQTILRLASVISYHCSPPTHLKDPRKDRCIPPLRHCQIHWPPPLQPMLLPPLALLL